MRIIDSNIAQQYSELRWRLRKRLHELEFYEITSPACLWKPQSANTGHGVNYELRESIELHLRCALANGLDAIYELGRCFRHDDHSDETHLHEFHMLETFKRGLEYSGLLQLTRDLLEAAFGAKVDSFDEINVAQELQIKFPSLDFSVDDERMLVQLRELTETDRKFACEAVDDLIDKKLINKNLGTLRNPAILTHFPTCTISLAKPWDNNPNIIQRFEVFVHGIEIAHGFVDDCDYIRVEQRMRKNDQKYLDKDFLELLKSGALPNTSAGVGFGIERLVMVANGITDIRLLVHCLQPHPKFTLES